MRTEVDHRARVAPRHPSPALLAASLQTPLKEFHVIVKKAGVLGVTGLVAALGIAAPSIAGGNKYASVTSTRDCGSGDTVALNGPLKLWPPNHKFVAEPVTATDSDPTSSVSLTITPSATDATGGDGGATHDPDWQLADGSTGDSFTSTGTGSATSELQLRAERSGKGEGRTYTINWTATFDNGSKTCSSTDSGQTPFTITVPHDMRGGADF